jgi:predicted acylesterase/phospholipase RssA/CRP-like cAMP-binding protein
MTLDISQLLRLHLSTSELSDDQVDQIAAHSELVEYKAGATVHSVDSPLPGLLLVEAGELEMLAVASDGSEQAIQYLGRDDQLGLLALFQTEPFPVIVRALQRCKGVMINKEAAIELLQELPLWRRAMMRRIGPRLRTILAREKRRRQPRVVTFLHATDQYRALTEKIIRRLTALGERVSVLSDHAAILQSASGNAASLLDKNGQVRHPDELRAEAAEWPAFDRLIIDGSANREAGYLVETVSSGDAIYCVCDTANTPRMVEQFNRVSELLPNAISKMHAIRVLGPEERVAPCMPQFDNFLEKDFKVHWTDIDDSLVCTRSAGIERIIHHLRGFALGLALGGGAARGMAHLGVLQVFEEMGLTLDLIAGTSAGALTGIPYAAGYPANWLINTFEHDLKPGKYYGMLPYGDAWYMLGKYRQGGWDGMLRHYLEEWELQQLPLPVTSVAADLVSASEIHRTHGDATHALLESINLPVMSRPICRDGMVLVDGGVLNVVPANVLVERGATVVIAVDVSARIRFEFVGNSPGTPTSEMKVPNATQTAIRVRTVQDRNIRSLGTRAADLVIEPDVSGVELSDFQHASQIAKLGRAATEEALPELKSLLNSADPDLFPFDP